MEKNLSQNYLGSIRIDKESVVAKNNILNLKTKCENKIVTFQLC